MFSNGELHSEAVDIDGVRHISTVPWKEWNLHACVTSWESNRSVHNVVTCGTRIVRLLPNASWDSCRLQICDFNPYARHQVRNEPRGHKTAGEKTQSMEEEFDANHVGRVDRMQEDIDEENKGGHPSLVTHKCVDANPPSTESTFEEPVVSALPYLETTTVEGFASHFVMMDMENIYLLKVSITCFQNTANPCSRMAKFEFCPSRLAPCFSTLWNPFDRAY